MSRMALEDRLFQHQYNGSIFYNFKEHQNCRPDSVLLYNYTNILYKVNNRSDIAIIDALYIKDLKPIINDNLDDFRMLKLFI
jgi:hypothetical protein